MKLRISHVIILTLLAILILAPIADAYTVYKSGGSYSTATYKYSTKINSTKGNYFPSSNGSGYSGGSTYVWKNTGSSWSGRIVIPGNSSNPSPSPSPAPEPSPKPDPAPKPQPQPNPQPNPGSEEGSTLLVIEARMVQLINRERVNVGLNPLAVDSKLISVARRKSKDMADNNYFSHTSPVFGSTFNLLRSEGVQYRRAGENIAGASSVDSAHRALMNSSGHKANILSPYYTHVGIGAASDDYYGILFTQVFIER